MLVVISPEESIGNYLDLMHRIEVEPQILEVEGAVLGNLCPFLGLSDSARLALDIGHSGTNVCLLVDGKPVVLRSIPDAGHHQLGAHLTRSCKVKLFVNARKR